MADKPSTPVYHTSNWSSEQQTIGNSLGLLNVPTPQEVTRSVSNTIISNLRGHYFKIRMDHPHTIIALDHIKKYPFPKDIQGFYQSFRIREWDMVCEAMLMAVRVKRLVPNEFQQFMLRLYINEHEPSCCCHCGLTQGWWCGELFLLLLFMNYFLIKFLADESDSDGLDWDEYVNLDGIDDTIEDIMEGFVSPDSGWATASVAEY